MEILTSQDTGTIQILSDALPKIVPYVLINHREVIEQLASTFLHNELLISPRITNPLTLIVFIFL